MLRGSREFRRSVLEVAGHVASGRLVPTQGLQFLKRVQANVNVKLGEAEGQPEGAAQIRRFQEAVVDTLSTLYQQVRTNMNTYMEGTIVLVKPRYTRAVYAIVSHVSVFGARLCLCPPLVLPVKLPTIQAAD